MSSLYRSLLLSCLGLGAAGSLHAQEAGLLGASLDELLDLKISTAARHEQTTREAPASVTIITAEDIERYSYHTLSDVFRGVRGFYVSYDRNYDYLGVRGFGRPTDYNNRILLQVNGRSINENIWGAVATGTEFGLGLDAIERIEIVRGPGSALYGTHAMFAVVNLITRTGNTMDGLKVAVESGSYGTREAAGSYGKEFANGLDLSVSGRWGENDGQDLYYQEYDDPATNNGVAQDLDWDKYYGVIARGAYRGFILQGRFVSREKGIPTGSYETDFNDARAKTLDENSFIELAYDHKIGRDKNLVLKSGLSQFHYRGWYPYEVLSLDQSHGHWWTNELQAHWDIRADNHLILGVEYYDHFRAKYRVWDEDVVYFDGGRPYRILSFYIQDEYQMTEKLALTLGLRRDRYSTVGTTTTPRGALVYHPTRSGTLKLLYGEAFRAPNMYEII